MSLKDEWSFRENRIDPQNLGEHDGDNRFFMETVPNHLKAWREEHPGCTPIGICYDESEKSYGCYPMVFEDENGNRFYTHVDIKAVEECIEMEENNA